MNRFHWLTNHLPLLAGLMALLLGIWILGSTLDAAAAMKWLLGRIQASGGFAPLFFILLYILAAVLLIPGSILTLGAGVLFGVLWGSVLASIAATLGAAAAFLIGRYLARGWVEHRIRGSLKFNAVNQAVAREGWKVVLLTRLSPIFPYTFLNYAFGLTRVSFPGYFLASLVGMLPATVMYVYIGSLFGSLALIGAQQRSRTPGEWILYGLGLLATIGVTIYVTRLARRALKEKFAPEWSRRGKTPEADTTEM